MNKDNWQERTELLLGSEKLDKLKKSHVLVAGIGGVGGYAAEQLCRAGIGKLTLVDSDVIHSSNRNRQVIALKSTEGQMKTDVFRNRLLDMNPELNVILLSEYLLDDSIDNLLKTGFDYIVDAIDTLTPKVQLLSKALKKSFPIVSSMGAGGKLDPNKIEIADISESHHCKFASMVRKYLHRQGIFKGIKVVYSPERVSKKAIIETEGTDNKRSVVGTISYMPPIFGCYCAAVVINDIIGSFH